MEMEARRIEKEYLALVWGWPENETFAVDAPILRQGKREPSAIYLKQKIHPDGALARTRFRIESRFTLETSNGSQFALVRCFPETGRMHQIRVHLSHAGHSVVGDKIYGPDENCYLEFIRTGMDARAGRSTSAASSCAAFDGIAIAHRGIVVEIATGRGLKIVGPLRLVTPPTLENLLATDGRCII